MLRSWTERLRIYLHPDQVVLIRETGIFRRHRISVQSVKVEGRGEYGWTGPLAALKGELLKIGRRRLRAEVMLAGDFTRLRIAPWDNSPESRASLVQRQFEETHGEAARTWKVTISDAGFGRSSPACAVDPRLMQALHELGKQTNIRLVSVRPYLMALFNRWRREISEANAWIAIAEPSQLTIALIQDGEWRSVRCHRILLGGAEELELLLAREALQQGVTPHLFMTYLALPALQQAVGFDKLLHKPLLPSAMRHLSKDPFIVAASCA